MTFIVFFDSQKFQFRSATPLTSVDEIESSADMKTVEFLFKFSEEEEVSVSQEIVQNQLDALVKSFRELDLQAWPELYQDFVWFMKHSTEENLQLIINDVLDCHGNKNGTCDLEKKVSKRKKIGYLYSVVRPRVSYCYYLINKK